MSEELPFIDRHTVVLPVARDVAWTELQQRVESTPMLRSSRGFPQREAVEGKRLRLAGEHPFARYALTLELADDATGTKLEAVTHARFNRGPGQRYRHLVITSTLHARVVRRFLAGLRRQCVSRQKQ